MGIGPGEVGGSQVSKGSVLTYHQMGQSWECRAAIRRLTGLRTCMLAERKRKEIIMETSPFQLVNRDGLAKLMSLMKVNGRGIGYCKG